jgi:hypothetical protein
MVKYQHFSSNNTTICVLQKYRVNVPTFPWTCSNSLDGVLRNDFKVRCTYKRMMILFAATFLFIVSETQCFVKLT